MDTETSWKLRKTDAEAAAYELETKADSNTSKVMLHVISGLLDGMQVGIIAEGDHAGLCNVWRDGRVLKRAQGSAFVALDYNMGELPSEQIAACIGKGVTLRFIGFDESVPDDTVFRSLMGGDHGAAIEVSCKDLHEGILSFRLDSDKIDENTTLNGISDAVGDYGKSLLIAL